MGTHPALHSIPEISNCDLCGYFINGSILTRSQAPRGQGLGLFGSLLCVLPATGLAYGGGVLAVLFEVLPTLLGSGRATFKGTQTAYT